MFVIVCVHACMLGYIHMCVYTCVCVCVFMCFCGFRCVCIPYVVLGTREAQEEWSPLKEYELKCLFLCY